MRAKDKFVIHWLDQLPLGHAHFKTSQIGQQRTSFSSFLVLKMWKQFLYQATSARLASLISTEFEFTDSCVDYYYYHPSFIYLFTEGNVVSLSSTLPSFTRSCDRKSGICSKPICTICITILLKPVIKQCKSSYMLFAVTLTQHLLVAGIQRRKRRNFLIQSRGLF